MRIPISARSRISNNFLTLSENIAESILGPVLNICRMGSIWMRGLKLACLISCLSLFTFLLSGCLRSQAVPTPSSLLTPTPTGTAPSASAPPMSVYSSSDNWPTYHRDLSRSGFYPGVSLGASLHRLWTSEILDGDIYAEPLVLGGKVLAATEHDSVYSLDISNGKILWQAHLGTPVYLSELSCGDIDPSGITSTPVVDPAAGRLYVVARIQPNHHELFVLDIQDGNILSHQPVDPPGADPRVQQQRAALALSNGRVYIPFGGLWGDCGAYHGWVVGVPVAESGQIVTYQVSPSKGASLWAPSGAAIDSAGNLYVASGNGFSGSNFDYGNSVLRLSPDLSLTDWFAPENWQELDNSDGDLGSMGPILLQDGTIFQAGKEGIGYLLRSDNLGHIGGEIFSGAIGRGAYGGAAYAPPYVFVPCTDGLKGLNVDTAAHSFKVAWSSPGFFAGPPVVAGNTVWTVDTRGDSLYGFTVDHGDLVVKVPLGSPMHFTTPVLSRDSILVAANRQIIKLGP